MQPPWHALSPDDTFLYNTEFKQSSIPNGGRGWWANEDIPANNCIRRASIDDGSLIRIQDQEGLQKLKWDIAECVNYAVCHPLEPLLYRMVSHEVNRTLLPLAEVLRQACHDHFSSCSNLSQNIAYQL